VISILDFESKYAPAFRQLNLEWLEKYGLTEEPDLIMINNPQEEIIDTGGFIFLAKSGNEIVGTVALIKESPTQFELVKMAVAPFFQGKGISRLLMEKCLQAARESGAKRIYLQSNSQLTTAIALYEKYGFKHIPVKDAHYLTADVMMELLL
jgi:GNAT superfamily N-acetyltransferase